jgi:hypothetical protein
MPNFHYFHPSDNVAPNATPTIQTGTANASYPVANATLLTYAKIAAPSKIAETSGAWLLDFGSAQRVDAVLVWTNLDAGIAYSIQMNATNSWATPTVDSASTAPSKRADGYTVKIYKDLTGVSGYSSGGFRYLRFYVSGTNSVPVGIKILAFSQIRTTTRNIRWGMVFAEHQTSIDMTTDALVPWAYDLAAAPRGLSADFIGTDADAVKMREWFRACAGRVNPTVIVPDPSSPDPFLCRWSKDGVANVIAPRLDTMASPIQRDFTNVQKMRLAFEEISAGDPEWD